MQKEAENRRPRYSYWCFNCKRKVRAEDITRKIPKEGGDPSTEDQGYRAPFCPYCGERIKRNYKVWCHYCQRTVKASDLILHRTLEGQSIRLCPHCGWDKKKKSE